MKWNLILGEEQRLGMLLENVVLRRIFQPSRDGEIGPKEVVLQAASLFFTSLHLILLG
jgi:hypothetical protein